MNKGGNKQKKKANRSKNVQEARKLEIREDDTQIYGQIIKALGNCKMQVKCHDGKDRMCHIRGKMRNRGARLVTDDIVLISIRDFQNNEGDIIFKYTSDEVRKLKSVGSEKPYIESLLSNNETQLNKNSSNDVTKEVSFEFDSSVDSTVNKKSESTKKVTKNFTSIVSNGDESKGIPGSINEEPFDFESI